MFMYETASLTLSAVCPQVWMFGDMSLSSGSSGRFSVQTVNSDHGVLSSLILSETLAQDFQLRYNCTAWNRFGTGTVLVTLKEQGEGKKNKTQDSVRGEQNEDRLFVNLFTRVSFFLVLNSEVNWGEVMAL